MVSQFQVGALFKQSYGKTSTGQNATNGFDKTGIIPFNVDISRDYMYEAFENTNNSFEEKCQPGFNTQNNNTELTATQTLNIKPLKITRNLVKRRPSS